MGVSKNNGIPKSSILIGFSIINHPFWGTPIFEKHPYINKGRWWQKIARLTIDIDDQITHETGIQYATIQISGQIM